MICMIEQSRYFEDETQKWMKSFNPWVLFTSSLFYNNKSIIDDVLAKSTWKREARPLQIDAIQN